MKHNKNFVKAFEESSFETISQNVLEIHFHLVELYKSYGIPKGEALNKADKIIEEAFTEWKQKRHEYNGEKIKERFIKNIFAM